MVDHGIPREEIELNKQLTFYNDMFGWARVATEALTHHAPPDILYGPSPAGVQNERKGGLPDLQLNCSSLPKSTWYVLRSFVVLTTRHPPTPLYGTMCNFRCVIFVDYQRVPELCDGPVVNAVHHMLHLALSVHTTHQIDHMLSSDYVSSLNWYERPELLPRAGHDDDSSDDEDD